ncbi:hypothetical protein [Vibrio sp. T11.5]|uniref:hypothetical protein n=1 Tax=Vibrio sp. T11.5 TaxID=2998836 RepID=UPI0022CDB15F|nr:hypothetical protein [Vibrio sp. T11.5]MDA0120879.1 hypothetical protein [Vibrio sp. T11.5]
MSNKIRILNNSDQPIYVIATLNKDWLFFDSAMFALKLAKSASSLLSSTTNAAKLTYKLGKLSRKIQKQAKANRDFFKKNGLQINPQQQVKVLDKSNSILKILEPSHLAGLLGASDITLTMMTEDGEKFIQFNTNSDRSWIAFDNRIVAAKKDDTKKEERHSGIKYWDTYGRPKASVFGDQIGEGDWYRISEHMGTYVGVWQDYQMRNLFYGLAEMNDHVIKPLTSANKKYTTGRFPSVAVLKKNIVVEVHESEKTPYLWSSIGDVKGSVINFSSFQKLFKGVSPSIVRVNDETVILTYNESMASSNIFYRIGTILKDKIRWTDSNRCGSGTQPTILFNGDKEAIVISSHNGGLYYRVGRIHDQQISWEEKQHKFIEKGVLFSASQRGGDIIVTYQKGSSGTANQTYQICGEIDTKQKGTNNYIMWENNISTGTGPTAVCFDSTGSVVGLKGEVEFNKAKYSYSGEYDRIKLKLATD